MTTLNLTAILSAAAGDWLEFCEYFKFYMQNCVL